MFDEFWALYPKKEAKKKSQELWSKLETSDRELAIAFLKKKPYRETEHRYVFQPTKFINGERWHDEIKGTSNKPTYLQPTSD
jgi:hypothetical protein